MKLKGQLRAAPIEVLRQIAEFWGIGPDENGLMEDTERLSDLLYSRLQSPAPFKRAFERLEVSEREVVYFLALHGGELPVDEFRRRMGLHDAAELDAVVGRLLQRGFVWRETVVEMEKTYEIVGLPEPFLRLVDLPPYWKGYLGSHLQALGMEELKEIAQRALDYKFEGKKKQVLVHFIREQLLDPAVLKRYLDHLAPVEIELFKQIFQKNGACLWRELLDGGVQKKFNHVRADLLERLCQSSGLVYVWRAGPNRQNNTLMVPRDLGHIIKNGFRRDERTLAELTRHASGGRASDQSESPRPNVALDNTQNILRDLAILLAYVRRQSVKMLNNGGVGRNDLKKIVLSLSHNKTPKYAAFLALFAMSKKLMIPVGDQWRVSKNAGDWLGDSRQAFREIYGFWLTTNEWNEEFIEGDVVHVDNYPQNLIGIGELRRLMLRALEKIPEGAWIDFETFAESLLPQVAIEIPGRFEHTPNERDNRHTLLIMESILAESFYWLGLVTLGVSDLAAARQLGSRPNDSASPFDGTHPLSSHLLGAGEFAFCFKPSPTARRMFDGKYLEPDRLVSKSDQSGLPYGEESAHFTVQPNLEIVTPPDLNLGLFYRLLAFADIKKVDIMTTLTLSRESLRMGMEGGLSGGEILEFLRASSRRELPETVLRLIEECGARHGEVDLGAAGGYIMAANPLHVEELRANPRVSRYIKDVFNERLILLDRTADLKRIAQELQKMGFMPHVGSETLHVTGEGLFHLTLRPQELDEIMALLHFAQTLEDEFGGMIFENRLQPLIERLAQDAKGEHALNQQSDPLLKVFLRNFEKLSSKRMDEEKKKLRKQVTRLMSRIPRGDERPRYVGENPTSDPAGVARLMKYAVEHEIQVKIHYVRSTGEEMDEVIEPESLQGDRLYAYCPDHDEHHIYSVKRVAQAAI